MRTFIALEFNKDLKNRLGRIQKKLKGNTVKGNWVYIDNFHITLKFLGFTNPQNLISIKTALGDISKNNFPIKLSINDLGYFPGKDILRVVWLGVNGETKSLIDLNRQVEKKMNSIGFSKEQRKFVPHITLGRNVLFESTIYKLKDLIKKDLDYTFYLDTINLMSSEFKDGKRIYTSIGRYRLGK